MSAPFRAAASLRAGRARPLDRAARHPHHRSDHRRRHHAGYFAFGGKIVNAHGRSPFEIEAAPSWERALAGFGWLRHLRAADTALARANAQALVDEFLALRGKPDAGPAWESVRRCLVASVLVDAIAAAAGGRRRAYHRRVMRGLARARAHLRQALAGR